MTVGLAAPGGLILSTTNDGAYGQKSGTSMAAPMVSGVAALMVSVNPNISAIDLRAQLLQHARRTRLPVAAGYVDALQSVLAATTAVGHDSTQPPQLRILRATTKGRRTQLQVAVVGATQGIRSYRVRLDRSKVAGLAARGATFTVTLPGGDGAPRSTRSTPPAARSRPPAGGEPAARRQARSSRGYGGRGRDRARSRPPRVARGAGALRRPRTHRRPSR